MFWRAIIAAIVVVGVSEMAERFPRFGALLLTLPIVSIIAFIAVWQKTQDINVVTRLGRETLILVPLGLPFFVPFAFSQRLGLNFWSAFVTGLALASVTIGLWFWLGPQTSSPSN